VQPGADRHDLPKIEGGAVDWRDLTRRDLVGAGRRVAVGIDQQQLICDRARAVAREVEVGMVGEVDDCVLVRGRGVIDPQHTVVGQRVDNLSRQGTGKALVTVLADVTEAGCDPVLRRDRRNRPDLVIQCIGAAV